MLKRYFIIAYFSYEVIMETTHQQMVYRKIYVNMKKIRNKKLFPSVLKENLKYDSLRH